MRRLAPLLLLVLAGCATMRDRATVLLYAAERKVLVFIPVPCAQTHPTKPYMVSGWVREKDLGKMLVVCDADCNCRLTKSH